MFRKQRVVAAMAAVMAVSAPSIIVARGSTQASATTPAPRVDLSKYPAVVRAAIEAETKNATFKHVSKETEKGQTQYEVETLVDGKSRDLLVDPSGKVIEVEEEIAVDAAPAPVQAALNTRGKVLKLERVTRSTATTYEASVLSKTGKKSSVALGADGKPIKG